MKTLEEQYWMINTIRKELSILYPDDLIPSDLYNLERYMHKKKENLKLDILSNFFKTFIDELMFFLSPLHYQNLDQLKDLLERNPDAFLILEYRAYFSNIPEIINYFKLKRFLNENN